MIYNNMVSVCHLEPKRFEFWSQDFCYCPNLLWLTKFDYISPKHGDI